MLQADYEIAATYESVRLLGANTVVNAADMLRYSTWELCDAARGLSATGEQKWNAAYAFYRDQRAIYYTATRLSLNIPDIEKTPPPSDQNPVSRTPGVRASGEERPGSDLR
ncbi:hypothetical protein GCM10027176_30230 [Actinoallomurus bryophytorum]